MKETQGPREMLECGHVESAHIEFTRGYGTDAEGNRHCYACCAKQDIEHMKQHGKITLYLTKNVNGAHRVRNWPGSLDFPVIYFRKWEASAFGGSIPAMSAWFVGPDNHVWLATQKGDMDLARCKRTKQVWKAVKFLC